MLNKSKMVIELAPSKDCKTITNKVLFGAIIKN